MIKQYDIIKTKKVKDKISTSELNGFEEFISSIAKESIGLYTFTNLDKCNFADSRFGDVADIADKQLAKKINPKSVFVAQINLSQIKHLNDYLPSCGMLYFYINGYDEIVDGYLYMNDGERKITCDVFYEKRDIKSDKTSIANVDESIMLKPAGIGFNSFISLPFIDEGYDFIGVKKSEKLNELRTFLKDSFDSSDFYDEMLNEFMSIPENKNTTDWGYYTHYINGYAYCMHESIYDIAACRHLRGLLLKLERAISKCS